MRRRHAWIRRPLLLTACLALAAGFAAAARSDDGLRRAADFASIADSTERSAAIFREAGRVLLHPRCVNCHPAGDTPLQGEEGSAHEPPVRRGLAGAGVPGMRCKTCHLDVNFDPGRIPGAPHWVLAPRRMAWEGFSLTEICEQIKDPERNGRRSLDEIVEHMSEDALVGWAWSPGADRKAPPGTQEHLGELIEAWADSGAACP